MGAIHPICIIIDENESSVGTNLAALSLSSLMVFSGQKKIWKKFGWRVCPYIYLCEKYVFFLFYFIVLKDNNSCIYLSSKLA